jgi:hypothetical protein
MEITDTLRLERFENANEIQKKLYAGSDIGFSLQKLASRFSIPDSVYVDFVTIFGDIVLGFYPITSLEQNLKNNPSVSPFVSEALTTELSKLLQPLMEEGPNEYSTLNTSVQEDVEEIEKILHQISPVRTMASDSGQPLPPPDTTYSSMQSAILREGKGQQINPTRWDSEN